MKINLLMSFIAVVVSGMVFYGIYEIIPGKLLFPSLATVTNIILLFFTMGVSFAGYPRSTVKAKTVTGVLWFVALVMNIMFAIFNMPNVVLIISNVIIVCIWGATVYGISKVKQ